MSVVYTDNGGSSLDNLPDVLTREDVQKFLKISKSVACELLVRGELKGWKIGCKWRITKSALITYIERAERNDIDRITHTA